ncbi:MAG: AAA family ATPase, partial [Gammaproteobacteria bacterium]|nr:AAA family ATPase [Gammaproteobacteria bacterium]
MKCSQCQREVAADFAFCPGCGSKLAAATAPAAASPAATPAATPPAAAPADRRTATVLFADLSGFTAISERLDPEDVRALQSDLFGALREVVLRHGAFVEKFVGDAVMAVFGAPVAHEDDPVRAMHAALDMHAAAATLGASWQQRIGQPLALHIGVHSGRVVAGMLGAGADAAYAVTGDTVNTAARLQSGAGAGQTMVSRATFLLAQHAFAFEPGASLILKGKSEPVAVYRLLGVAAGPRELRGLAAHGLASPLMGRDDELARLRDTMHRVLGGQAHVLSVVAEAGIGKTRLIDTFVACIGADPAFAGTVVRRVACSPLGQRPYGVAADLFREAYGIAADDALAQARGKVEHGLRGLQAAADELDLIVPVVGYILGMQAGAGGDGFEPERLQRQIFAALRTAIERRLAAGPLVLVVEGLQWADAASIEALASMANALHDRALLLLPCGRPPFDPLVLDYGRASHSGLRLAPLADRALDALLLALFGGQARHPLESRLHERIVRQAGGNPLYLEELVRGLIADGVLVRDDDGWRCVATAADVQVPSSIEALLLSRADLLPAQARRALQSAAILGLQFDAALLSALDAAADATTLALLCDSEWLVALPQAQATAPVPVPVP